MRVKQSIKNFFTGIKKSYSDYKQRKEDEKRTQATQTDELYVKRLREISKNLNTIKGIMSNYKIANELEWIMNKNRKDLFILNAKFNASWGENQLLDQENLTAWLKTLGCARSAEKLEQGTAGEKEPKKNEIYPKTAIAILALEALKENELAKAKNKCSSNDENKDENKDEKKNEKKIQMLLDMKRKCRAFEAAKKQLELTKCRFPKIPAPLNPHSAYARETWKRLNMLRQNQQYT